MSLLRTLHAGVRALVKKDVIAQELDDELRDYVEKQGPADKVVHMPSFREPMMVRVPSAMMHPTRERSSVSE